MTKDCTYSIFFHNYYGNDHYWVNSYSEMATQSFNLFYNYVSDSYNRLTQPDNIFTCVLQSKPDIFEKLVIRESTNKGKDIGGKLVLMDAYLRLDARTDYILLLHDKRSPHQHNGGQWRNDLFRIAQKENREKVFKLFDKNPQTGIIASKNAIINEAENDRRTNAYLTSALMQSLTAGYNIHPPHQLYVAGTMFWVRASLFEQFFTLYPPLQIRGQLEDGNVTDEQPTYTHAWERLLCWLVTSKGYKIAGI